MTNYHSPNGKIKALCCGTVLESTHVHDFKHCKCGKVFIDGGNRYLRYGWPSGGPKKFVEVLVDPRQGDSE